MAYVPVKVYRNNEIRRFLLESGDNNRFAFQNLLNQVRQVYPTWDTNRVRVMWKDSDGEMVVMSSDLELMDAIRSLPPNDQMLRLQLVNVDAEPDVVIIEQEQSNQPEMAQEDSQEQQNADQEPKDPDLHRHVFCDGCQGSIRGIRHKCLTCPDYDLCSECIQKGIHDEHPMIRIASPKDKTWKPAFIAAQAPFPFPFPHKHWHRHRGPHPPPPPPAPAGCVPPPPPTGPALPPMGPPGGFFPFGSGRGCGHRGRGGRHCRRWGPVHPFVFQDDQMETEQTTERAQEKPGEQPKGFNAQEFARDLTETITSVMTAIGIRISTPTPAPPSQESAAPTANPPAETASASVGPAPVTHSDPKIAAALNYMLAMGYTNEGGWLTKLLEEKRGDISAVLDVLHPRQGQ